MKKVLLLLVAVSFSFVSCDKNDDNQVAETSLIHGMWGVKSFKAEETVNGTPTPDEDLDFNNVIGTIFEFRAEGMFLVTTYDDFDEKWVTEEGTYIYHAAQNKVEYTMVESDGTKYTQTMNIKLLNTTNYNFNITEEVKDGSNVYKLSMDINCEKVK